MPKPEAVAQDKASLLHVSGINDEEPRFFHYTITTRATMNPLHQHRALNVVLSHQPLFSFSCNFVNNAARTRHFEEQWSIETTFEKQTSLSSFGRSIKTTAIISLLTGKRDLAATLTFF